MSRFQRMIGGWLGLLAILMASLAPTVSHTLALHHAREAMADGHCDMASMPMPMPSDAMQHDDAPSPAPPHVTHATHATHAPADTSTQHSAMPDGDACGYCSLLAHLPVMPSVAALFVVSVLVFAHTVAVRFQSVRRAEPLTFAQPRAPPFIA